LSVTCFILKIFALIVVINPSENRQFKPIVIGESTPTFCRSFSNLTRFQTWQNSVAFRLVSTHAANDENAKFTEGE